VSRVLITLACLACLGLLSAPATQAAPVSAKTVCKKRVVRAASGKKRTVKRCWKVRKTAKKASSTTLPASVAPPAPGGIRAELRECATKERRKVGLGPLSDDPALDAAAQAHALDMKQRNYFEHETPGGKSPFDRIDAALVSLGSLLGLDRLSTFDWMGENIARGFADADATCAGWMNSPGHKANILRPQFDAIGTGWVDGYAVQDFGGRD
jgi:uncharacterized protein YkwD